MADRTDKSTPRRQSERRLAEALRANLRRRKSQARGRADSQVGEDLAGKRDRENKATRQP